MLVFGRSNKCVTNKNNLCFLMTKHYKFCKWEFVMGRLFQKF